MSSSEIRYPLRIVHYLNQFFGGIGGEEQADVSVQVREGPIGPGIGLEQALGERGRIVATIICGDNYFNTQMTTAKAKVLQAVEQFQPDVIVAGPAFNAGRYGVACGEVCKEVAEQLKIPAVTAMYPENPAVETYRRASGVWILPTGATAADMRNVLPRLAAFVLKVGSGVPIGPVRVEGYIPTGRRCLELATVPGVDRAISMLLAKLAGQPFQTEIPIESFESVLPAPPIKEIKTARLALITTAGLVPKGNPDGFKMFNATRWNHYSLPEDLTLRASDWEVIHGGFNTAYAQANPHLILPVDVLRDLRGLAYGQLHDQFYSITGVGTSLTVAKRAGQEIVASLRDAEVDAALLVAT